MGQWYNIGLQAGREVAKDVDAFIKAEHKSDRIGDNFDPAARKELKDGSVIYSWYMKWQPEWYEDEKRFMEVLRSFSDDAVDEIVNGDDFIDDAEVFAWKLVAVGDEGGQDERGNTLGFDTFDGLYDAAAVTFPESFEEEYGEDTVKKLEETDVDDEAASQVIAGLLMDDTISTCDMFDSLSYEYRNGSAEFRKGMDRVLSILTYKNMDEITDEVKKAAAKATV